MSGGSASPLPPADDRAGAEATLLDLPKELWHDLARAFRRAVEFVEDAELPPAVRPFRGWKPDRLLRERPRRAIAQALATDARLRERLADELGGDAIRAQRGDTDAARLAAAEGEARAATILVAGARWSELAALAASAGERITARDRAAAERQREREAVRADDDRRRLERELANVRRDRDQLRGALEQAEARARAVSADRDHLAGEVQTLRAEVAKLKQRVREEGARHRDRLERTKRRAASAEARLRVDDERVRRTADDLESLAGELRAALVGPEGAAGSGPGEPDGTEEREGTGERKGIGDIEGTGKPEVAPAARVPRSVPAASPGRPCGLPAGLTTEDVDGLRAVLQVAGITVVVDGYNVSKDPLGLPEATLEDQRQWLVRVTGGVVAQYGVRAVVVFDSAERQALPPGGGRRVVVEFATDDETADDRIVGLVTDLDPKRPVVVITADRELADRCRALGADISPPRAFLGVAGA